METNREAVDFTDPLWNRTALARMQGDLSGALVHGYARGTITGVRDHEAVRPLLGYEVFSTTRLEASDSGDYRRLRRELVLYTDLEAGAYLDHWENPYTGERVQVMDITNDPVNAVITPTLLDWTDWADGRVALAMDNHLFYTNALDPKVWRRESAGQNVRASEYIRASFKRVDLEDPRRTHVPYTGTWSRITPWLPWMLMGQAAGHIHYLGFICSYTNLADVPPRLLARIMERYPKFLLAPTEWSNSSLSSLENYARDQAPARP